MNDCGMADTSDTSLEDVRPETGTTAVLHRPREGRYVAGVAAGIADRLGVPRWAIRLAFVLLLASGGAGLLLYLAGWLLIPGEGEPQSVGQRWASQANSTQPWVGIVLILVAAAVLFSNLPFFDGGLLFPTALLVIGILLYRGDLPGINWKPRTARSNVAADPTEDKSAMTVTTEPTLSRPPRPVVVKPRTPPSPLGRLTIGATIVALGLLAIIDRLSPAIDADVRHYLALSVAVLGVGVLVGTFWGRARWLIPIGLLILPPMLGASVVESVDGDWRTPRLIRPTDFAAVATTYDRSAGELVIDLTDLAWNGETVEFSAEVGAGRLELVVPVGVAVEARGSVGMGELSTPIFSSGGFGVSRDLSVEGAGRGTVVATLEVGVGQIDVAMPGNRLFDGRFPGESFTGDLVAYVNSPEALEDSYITTEGDITLDLADLVLTEDRVVQVVSDFGDISVTLPAGTSYRVQARTDFGVVDLFGEDQIDRGGVVRADSIVDGPVIELIVQSSDGDIHLTQGGRS